MSAHGGTVNCQISFSPYLCCKSSVSSFTVVLWRKAPISGSSSSRLNFQTWISDLTAQIYRRQHLPLAGHFKLLNSPSKFILNNACETNFGTLFEVENFLNLNRQLSEFMMQLTSLKVLTWMASRLWTGHMSAMLSASMKCSYYSKTDITAECRRKCGRITQVWMSYCVLSRVVVIQFG